ncbi:MAG: hypothetical protein AAGF12_10520 [Myxococcota bacterium]
MGCPPGLLVLELRPPGAPPIDVEVSSDPARGFLPAGDFALSPLVEVAEYGDLPAPQRDAIEALAAYLRDGSLELTENNAGTRGPSGREHFRDRAVAEPLPLLGPLVFFAALLLAIRRPATRKERRHEVAVFGFALLFRGVLGIWGPYHINGQGPMWIAGVIGEPEILGAYGPGYAEALGTLAILPVPIDFAVFSFLALLSAGAAFYGLRLARRLGLRESQALAVGGLLAAHPILVRIASTESYFTLIVFLSVFIAWAVVEAASHNRRGTALGYGALALVSTLLALRIHPVAWPATGLALGLVIAAEVPLRRRAWVGFGLGVGLTVTLLLAGAWLSTVLASVGRHRGGMGDPLSPEPVLLGLGAAVLCLVVRRPALFVPVAIALPYAVITRYAYGQSEAWKATYDSVFLLFPALAVASLLPTVSPVRGAAIGTAGAGVLLLLLPPTTPTTEQLEYAVLRRELPGIDEPCDLAFVHVAGNRRLHLPTYLIQELRPVRIEGGDDLLRRLRPEGCTYFLEGSICSSEEGRPICSEVLSAVETDTLQSYTLPAVPSYDGLPYDRPRVRLALYRVRTPRR